MPALVFTGFDFIELPDAPSIQREGVDNVCN